MKIMKWFRSKFIDDISMELETYDEPMMPFLTFPCEECKSFMVISDYIHPGDVAVVKCENCNESWSVYCKPLEISKTSEFEEVWPRIAEDIKQENLFHLE